MILWYFVEQSASMAYNRMLTVNTIVMMNPRPVNAWIIFYTGCLIANELPVLILQYIYSYVKFVP